MSRKITESSRKISNDKDNQNTQQMRMTKSCDLEKLPSPTCCIQYPPGCTVLECRLDGNQPVAQVVHMPSDSSPSPAMCLLVETRQSENGPFSRVSARPEKNVTTTPQAQVSYHLESHNGPKGAVAIAGRSPAYLDGSSAMSGPPLTLLETTKSQGPTARLFYHPTAESENYSQQVSTHIKCTTTPKGPFAKVTQTSRDKEAVNRTGESNTCFETSVKVNGSCPIASVIENGLSPQTEILETKIIDGAVVAKGVVKQNGTSLYLESKPCGEVSSAKIDQRVNNCKLDELTDTLQGSSSKKPLKIKEEIASEMCSVSPLSYILEESSEKRLRNFKPAALSRRNGLDPTPSEIQGKEGKWKYMKPIKMFERPRAVSDRCHASGRLDAVCSDEKGECKMQKKLAMQKQSESLKREVEENDLKLRRFEEVPLPSADELIKEFREYLSEGQLKKYEYCTSKRNGLQDECYLPVPRAVVEIKRKEMKTKEIDEESENK